MPTHTERLCYPDLSNTAINLNNPSTHIRKPYNNKNLIRRWWFSVRISHKRTANHRSRQPYVRIATQRANQALSSPLGNVWPTHRSPKQLIHKHVAAATKLWLKTIAKRARNHNRGTGNTFRIVDARANVSVLTCLTIPRVKGGFCWVVIANSVVHWTVCVQRARLTHERVVKRHQPEAHVTWRGVKAGKAAQVGSFHSTRRESNERHH